MRVGRTTSAPRLMGKLGFVHVFMDGSYLQLSSNAELSTWETFRSLNQGDIVSFDGEWFTTKTGEQTQRVTQLEIVRKCELALPDRANGVSLGVSRRNRYLELLAEQVSPDRQLPYRETLQLRAKVTGLIRSFLNNRGFLEVTTPTLIENPFGADARPFETDGYYLRIAPELELKKLVVGGLSNIYEIGKSFRNEGLSQKHNQEFTMLEFYGSGDYLVGIGMLVELLEYVIKYSFGVDAYYEGVNGIQWNKSTHKTIVGEFDESEFINPHFIQGFSAEDSPLAKIGEFGFAERFELYAGGMELANGYSEQDDWRIQQEVFERQGVVDTDYIDALKRGLPPTYGVGVGIDRLIMLFTGRNIKEVL